MTTYTIYVQKPQAALGTKPFADPVSIGMTIDDSLYQGDPPAVGTNTTFPTGEQLLYVQSILQAMQSGFEDTHRTRRGYRYVASSDGGTTFISARDS